MDDKLESKKYERFLLLRALYDATGGVAELSRFDIRDIGKQIGLDPNVALNTFEYLKGEGLVKWMALGGFGTITHWGVKEVEEALEGRPTGHFPANIVIVTQSPGANVVAGAHNQIVQVSGGDLDSQVAALRAALQSVGAPLTSAASELVEEAAKKEPDQIALASKARELASSGDNWKTALTDFVVGSGSGLVVEAIKFGLGIR